MGQFFKQTFASCLGTLLGLLVFSSLGVGGLAFLLLSFLNSSDSSSVKEKSVLVFNLATNISDAPPSSSLADSLTSESRTTLNLRQVIAAIEKAALDDNIVGLLLYGRGTVGEYGYATLTEVRQALAKFRQSGKKIIAYDMEWTEKEYYLASVAEKVIINPVGRMEINGLSSQQTFFADALEKYGVGVQVVKVGSFKGAVEPYTRQNLSVQNRQQLQTLLDTIWSNYSATVAKSRNLTPQQVQTISDTQGILEATTAKKAGFVDEVAHLDRVIVLAKELTGEAKNKTNEEENSGSFSQISLANYASSLDDEGGDSSDQIAIVYAEGTIVDGQGDRGEIGGDKLAKELRKLQGKEEVKAVVLRINSPGGSATASEVILREIKRLDAKKPVIISMGDVAASGGYWIAMGGQRIFADNDTITGSIGVFGLLLNIQKIANNNGIDWDTVKTGQLADISTITRPKNPQELEIYQAAVNRFYDLFIETVAKGRKLSPDKVRSVAQGRVWTGKDAVKIGLVDQIGGLEAAVQYAAKTAKLGDDWSLKEYPRSQSWQEELLSNLWQTYLPPLTKNNHPLTQEWQNFQQELLKLPTFNDPHSVYAKLLFNLDFR
ncbi:MULTISPECIES: signal peptide peptidase SppA [unclassified Microcystis]|uniref:signal peptide peptidase SppA n=1 Tax=unclassified Microcystis TaxID=2643300 RepID=UPI00118F5AF1|nr:MULTISPECIES: signal peptide peptidase SppA [unclassified Microcystis]MCA2928608.1 signal peptide peptidase SppA [Microcystis sp. M020S1]MCA2934499.1 signal peptide peptidase SppA [Microcystis sp. M015S1]MCA2622010.1 signal peptide peptidase SppA [Microcystis sp. M099S2]MCA2649664.1 signal peptide peptidase SppA [Microcystis sp. M065S2]MCA2681083.1 signal peptide peptidase SppA [Microcystis sp. M043S2]